MFNFRVLFPYEYPKGGGGMFTKFISKYLDIEQSDTLKFKSLLKNLSDRYKQEVHQLDNNLSRQSSLEKRFNHQQSAAGCQSCSSLQLCVMLYIS